ncbi:MAG: ATP cone domain-containing protein [Planctomycetota bacterium]
MTKRDGTLERFNLTKLSNCLATAMRARQYDPRLAGPLATAVAMHLQEWREPNPPTTAYIYRCVRAVLHQTGLGDVAAELAEHRDRRRGRRQMIRVLADGRPDAPGGPWSKGAIVRTLESGYGLRHGVARLLARQVEAQVFALDYRVVTKPFLRELVRNEVLAWGLVDDRTLRAGAAAIETVAAQQPQQEN